MAPTMCLNRPNAVLHNKVYSSTNIDEGWDGTYNGTNQPMGVYMYILEAVTDKGKPFTKQGNVTLIR